MIVACSKSNKGFTLTELIIVLSLLGIVLAGVFMLFDYTHKVYRSTEAQNILQDDLNQVLAGMANDIRSASKPDYATKAIIIYKSGAAAAAGDRIDIYDYKDNLYYKTSYIFESNTLKKGTVCKSTVTGSNGILNANVTYSAVLKGVQYPTDKELFRDITPDKNGVISDRRTIEINLLVKDEKGTILTPLNIPTTYTSRTRGTPK